MEIKNMKTTLYNKQVENLGIVIASILTISKYFYLFIFFFFDQ
jgi:hypothetical protein